ncbi:MAG: winged helix-turn-helix domain-containing protein [Bryobacteraceae bacterium]
MSTTGQGHSRSQTGKELYEFGPFRVDAERGILLRAGEPVQLTPKTFQILLVLIRHRQEVVTKDDLMKAVWPDTFVEEANLSRNIFMLRKALGETPQDHRYVVTVPGRGYRLAESVRLIAEEEISIVAANHSNVQVQIRETKPWPWMAVIVALLLAAGTLGLRVSWQRSPVLSGKDTLVLADFANSTADPVFNGTLRQGLAVQLEQSPFLSLISEHRIQQTLRLMGQAANTPLSAELARGICERTMSAAVLEGSIAQLGSQYVLGLRAKNCRTGKILDEEQAQAARKEDILQALSQIARKFRTRIGESLATIEKHETSLAEATTPSLEALKAYSAAWQVSFSTGFAAAVPLLQRAIEIDPDFAMAYAVLGSSYGSIGESALAAQSMTKAYQLRSRASDHERFFIMLSYDLLATGNLERAQQTGDLWAQTYPRDAVPHGFLAWINQLLGNYQRAMEEGKKAIDRDLDFAFGYNNLAWSYVFLNRLDEAKRTLQRASDRKLQAPDLLIIEYYIAFLRNDKPGMAHAALLGKEKAGTEDWISYEQALVLACSGHLREAIRMSQRAVDLARQAGQPERAALYQVGAALFQAFVGEVFEARRSAMTGVLLSKARDVEYGAAFALAISGNSLQSEALSNDLAQRFPDDTFVRVNYLPTLRALLAMKQRKPSYAIKQLESTNRYDLATPGYWFAFFGNLYPTYVRESAYLDKYQPAEAAAEFQKILDHPTIVFSDAVAPLARLQLGRAFVLARDKPKARSAYENFLRIWKDADADIPILKQAKAEYRNLH